MLQLQRLTGQALIAAVIGAAGCDRHETPPTVIDFWAIGSEGEHVVELIRVFEQEHPSLRVRVQQIPWNAAHEKLLTAFAGDATPDLCQLGNTWIPEFVALDALVPLDERVAASRKIERADYFPGLWETNQVGETLYGIPWYGDTRVLFYRRDLLEQAGFSQPPETWEEWLVAMRAIKRQVGADRYALLIPTNEWEQPSIFALQTGADMLRDDGRYGDFQSPEFRRAFEFYVGLFTEGLAPNVRNTEVSNVWEEFARGYFAMYITGPWNIGEFRRRLPAEMQDKWATAVLPRPVASQFSVSQAGGCGLVMFRRSPRQDAAWQLIEFLSEPAQQARFYELTGNLPPRESSWQLGRLLEDSQVRAFHDQLEHAAPLPRVPEWEQITTAIMHAGQAAIAGRVSIDQALATLNQNVDVFLDKRRWMLARQDASPE
jgi:multiple sugar transport system substrate-binding protein